MRVKAFYMPPEGDLREDLSEEEIARLYKTKRGLLWLDFFETTADDGAFMEQQLGLHPLAVEDCVNPRIHPPKLDDFGDYIFIVVHGINHVVESDYVETAELGLFLGEHFVISSHNFPLYSVTEVERMVRQDSRVMKRGADFLAHEIIDALVDNVMPAIDSMNDVADAIDEAVIRQPQPVTLDGIMKLKRSTLRVHRVMSPQRDVLHRMSRGEFPLIKTEAQIFYRDIYDHLVRIEDLNQTIRDRAENALATYLSAVANRQNETMRVLSVVATIFLPLTLLAGIYGMNFDYMPELHWKWGYFAILGVIGLVILVLMWRFWASGWFARGRRKIAWIKPFSVNVKRLRGHPGAAKQAPRSPEATPQDK